MEIIIHKINSIKKLRVIPKYYGVEIDIRSFKSKLILNHEPRKSGDQLLDYLSEYKNGTIIFNIKEAGIEKEVFKYAKKFNVKSYFLLDVEHPFILTFGIKLKKNLAVRFSEYEPIELSKKFKKFTEWMWVDTINKLPINRDNLSTVKTFKTCLVSPERWGRKKDIKKYINYFKRNNYIPNAIMTDMKCSNIWEKFL